jgi:arsenite methyltransferase
MADVTSPCCSPDVASTCACSEPATDIRETVRAKYAAAARHAAEAPVAVVVTEADGHGLFGAALYSDEAAEAPAAAVNASLGCGVPTAVADLHAGETVLDLGSGAGADVLISAGRVGPTGRAIGLDMTDEMLELAQRNAAQAGATNVQFLKGHIEDIPLRDNLVDVVISNCVINLSGDKGRVLREAFRVLKPGGRFAVSDVVAQGAIPPDLRKDMEAWVGCIAGALEEGEYRSLLREAGFEGIEVDVTRVYDAREIARSGGAEWDQSALARFDASGGRMVSAFVRAHKPAATDAGKTCCPPTCCADER